MDAARIGALMTAIIRIVTALSRFFGGVAAAMVVTSLVLVCQMVVMEYVLAVPAPWPSEIVSYLMMGVAFLGTPYVFATGGHVGIGSLAHRLASPGGRIRGALSAFMSLVFAAGMTAMGIAVLAKAVREGWQADDAAWVALWIPYLTLPLGSALLALQCIVQLLAVVSGESVTVAPEADAEFPD